LDLDSASHQHQVVGKRKSEPERECKGWPPVCGELLILGKSVIRHTQLALELALQIVAELSGNYLSDA
jgi:hypothetical protein